MKIIIIGNGPAGTSSAKKINDIDKNTEITIISYEKYPYYSRPRLYEVLEGNSTIEQIQIYKSEWYKNKNINLLLNTKVLKIDIINKKVITNNNTLNYDKLILATGAIANIPDIQGINNDIYCLRTMDDAIKIKEKAATINEIIIIGGGLLGLELANSFININKKIKIIEIFKYLLNKQLDNKKSNELKNILEKKGFSFYLNEECKEIIKLDKKFIVKTNNNEIEGEMIIFSIGANPRIKLAKESNLATDKGIIVNSFLQTSNKDIYAAGDCIQLNDKVWGFIKSSIEQGNIAGENIINENTRKYFGTDIDAKLKISGINLNS